MDLLRTFLEVNRTRHFGRASHHLFVTQSAVSARIKLLEEQLGAALFTRRRNDIQLTAAGQRFVKTAQMLISMWEEARRSIQLEQGETPALTLGAPPSLWDILLRDWVLTLFGQAETGAVRLGCHAQSAERVEQGVLDKTLDLGIAYAPPQDGALITRQVAVIELEMVASLPGLSAQQAIAENYVQLDWGAAFIAAHARWFPELPPPTLQVNWSGLALEFLLQRGGAAYLPQRQVREAVEHGVLHRVADAPNFTRPVHVQYRRDHDFRDRIEEMIDSLIHAPSQPAKLAHDTIPPSQ
ncbi:LysR family transcriptional regulator [Magnetofaba australis]|uniref:Putative LysR family transcriptional regulator n=1 Tax=Magnetofaba australis IT-1 TaxID=1434232 RepID=A0A1Y2KBR0_9PROT|nr:LysR family transcriptional regulator [Magnetofaba australis]OSM07245.1 putative LysR family transcriptional regulator [Magnetofaba australis IT-1]